MHDILTQARSHIFQKKEKLDQNTIQESSSTLVDPALVSVLGVAKDGQGLNQEEASSTPGTKVKESKEESSSSNAPKEKGKSRKQARVTKPSTDSKLEKLDQKWSDRFNRLEAMLLSTAFQQPEPVFQPVVVSPAKPPPVCAVDNIQPFFQPQTDHRSTATDQPTGLSFSAACSPV